MIIVIQITQKVDTDIIIESPIDISYPYINDTSNKTPSISLQEVKNAMLELKQGKKEENGLYSNHFINGTDRLFVLITLLFNCMLIHGIAPDELLLGTMIPLITNSRGNKQYSDNYRSHTIRNRYILTHPEYRWIDLYPIYRIGRSMFIIYHHEYIR